MPHSPWISDLGPWLLHASLLRSLLFMFAASGPNVFFRGAEIEVQGQQNGVDLLFLGLREAKTSSMWSEIWGSPIGFSCPPQTGLLIHKETKALQGAWTLGVTQQKETKSLLSQRTTKQKAVTVLDKTQPSKSQTVKIYIVLTWWIYQTIFFFLINICMLGQKKFLWANITAGSFYQTTLVVLYGFDSLKQTVHKRCYIGHQTAVIMLYILDLFTKKNLFKRVISLGIRLHSFCYFFFNH